jgi:hypothetical protein
MTIETWRFGQGDEKTKEQFCDCGGALSNPFQFGNQRFSAPRLGILKVDFPQGGA